jgi:hypothetical protein
MHRLHCLVLCFWLCFTSSCCFGFHVSSVLPGYVSEREERIPDPIRNPQDRIDVRCEACRSVLKYVTIRFGRVLRAHAYAQDILREVKSYEVVAAVDSLCEEEVLRVTLAARDPPGTGFRFVLTGLHAEDEKRLFAGGWVTKIWVKECEEVLSRLEDEGDVVALFREFAEIWLVRGMRTEASEKESEMNWQYLESHWCEVCATATQYKATNPSDEL